MGEDRQSPVQAAGDQLAEPTGKRRSGKEELGGRVVNRCETLKTWGRLAPGTQLKCLCGDQRMSSG